MHASLSFLLLAIFIIIYSVIIELFTILFRLTGLTYEIARTQVISLLTNSGYTTTESEVILASKRRRKLAQITMLFGYAFTVVVVSTIVNAFLSLTQTEMEKILPIIVASAAFVLIMLLTLRITPIHNAMNRGLERIANQIMFGKNSNVIVLVDIYGKNAVVELFLEHIPQMVKDVPLSQCGLREQLNIHVLHIKRNQDMLTISGDTVLQTGDVLLLFGTYKNIRSVFENIE